MGCVLLGFVRESRKTEPYAVAQLIRSKIRSNGRSPIETASFRNQMLYPVELRAPVKKSRQFAEERQSVNLRCGELRIDHAKLFVRRFSNTEFVGRGTTAGLPDKFCRVDIEVRYVFNLENHL